ncbi:hypothetical protein U1530_13635, partial [Aeromonas caviae]
VTPGVAGSSPVRSATKLKGLPYREGLFAFWRLDNSSGNKRQSAGLPPVTDNTPLPPCGAYVPGIVSLPRVYPSLWFAFVPPSFPNPANRPGFVVSGDEHRKHANTL